MSIRLNIGSGNHPLRNWVNIDSDPAAFADVYRSVPPLPYPDEGVDEIYAGHFLEHLTREEADAFLLECYRCLIPGGQLGIMVPDTMEVMRRYISGLDARVEFPLGHWRNVNDLDEICELFLYSTVQESGHRWSYDIRTLTRTLERNRFRVVGEINRWMDPRVPVGAWYQVGLDSVKE